MEKSSERIADDDCGRAGCHVVIRMDGQPAARNDPWANDQDWVLVHLLMLRELQESVKAP
jgi:hypothetical protein